MCLTDKCDGPHWARGYCRRCYKRIRYRGLNPNIRKPSAVKGRKCSIEGCDNPRKYAETGWCQMHYHRHWRHGDVHSVQKAGFQGFETDKLSYRAAHARVTALWGKARSYPCVACARPAREWAYDGTDPAELRGTIRVRGEEYPVSYSVCPEFYMPMCLGCHRKMDGGARSSRRTHCKEGHEFTTENTYWKPDRTERACRECRAANARRRYLERKERKR